MECRQQKKINNSSPPHPNTTLLGTMRSFIYTRDINATVMQLHCSTQNAAKREVTVKQKLRAGNKSGRLWTPLQPETVRSVILHSCRGKKKTKDRSTYLRALNL